MNTNPPNDDPSVKRFCSDSGYGLSPGLVKWSTRVLLAIADSNLWRWSLSETFPTREALKAAWDKEVQDEWDLHLETRDDKPASFPPVDPDEHPWGAALIALGNWWLAQDEMRVFAFMSDFKAFAQVQMEDSLLEMTQYNGAGQGVQQTLERQFQRQVDALEAKFKAA